MPDVSSLGYPVYQNKSAEGVHSFFAVCTTDLLQGQAVCTLPFRVCQQEEVRNSRQAGNEWGTSSSVLRSHANWLGKDRDAKMKNKNSIWTVVLWTTTKQCCLLYVFITQKTAILSIQYRENIKYDIEHVLCTKRTKRYAYVHYWNTRQSKHKDREYVLWKCSNKSKSPSVKSMNAYHHSVQNLLTMCLLCHALYKTLKIKKVVLLGWTKLYLEILKEHNSSFDDAENSVLRRMLRPTSRRGNDNRTGQLL
jgi:hypothetical protein